MKKIAFAAALLASAGFATAAQATDSNTTSSVAVNAVLLPACTLSDMPSSVELSNEYPTFKVYAGVTCNYSGGYYSTIKSDNGGLVNGRYRGDAPVNYLFWFGEGGDDISQWKSASDYKGGVTSTGINGLSLVAGSTVKSVVGFSLKTPLTVAGNYSDTLTITVVPW